MLMVLLTEVGVLTHINPGAGAMEALSAMASAGLDRL